MHLHMVKRVAGAQVKGRRQAFDCLAHRAKLASTKTGDRSFLVAASVTDQDHLCRQRRVYGGQTNAVNRAVYHQFTTPLPSKRHLGEPETEARMVKDG